MKNLPDDYNIEMRCGRSQLVGKDWQGKNEYIYVQEYKTKVGMLTREEWKHKLMEAIRKNNELSLLRKIRVYCKKHCAWLKNEEEILEYSMGILAGRYYKKWDDFNFQDYKNQDNVENLNKML